MRISVPNGSSITAIRGDLADNGELVHGGTGPYSGVLSPAGFGALLETLSKGCEISVSLYRTSGRAMRVWSTSRYLMVISSEPLSISTSRGTPVKSQAASADAQSAL
jgi:hypothetical protein